MYIIILFIYFFCVYSRVSYTPPGSANVFQTCGKFLLSKMSVNIYTIFGTWLKRSPYRFLFMYYYRDKAYQMKCVTCHYGNNLHVNNVVLKK